MFTFEDYQYLLIYFKNDPFVYDLLQSKGYIHPPKPKSWFVLLIGSIIGQRISFRQAQQYRKNLYLTLTDNFTPYDLINYIEYNFNNCLPLDKIEIIRSVCIFIINNYSYNFNIWDLKNIMGIGDWTIKNTLIMLALNDNIASADYLLLEDSIIRRKLKDVNYNQNLWSPYRAVITWYLWH